MLFTNLVPLCMLRTYISRSLLRISSVRSKPLCKTSAMRGRREWTVCYIFCPPYSYLPGCPQCPPLDAGRSFTVQLRYWSDWTLYEQRSCTGQHPPSSIPKQKSCCTARSRTITLLDASPPNVDHKNHCPFPVEDRCLWQSPPRTISS